MTTIQDHSGIMQAVQRLHKLTSEKNHASHYTPGNLQRRTIAIIGAGPAGLSAALCLSRTGYHITLIEALPTVGGMMSVGIPAARLAREIVHTTTSTLLHHPLIDLHLNMEIGKGVTMANLLDTFDAIILAIGCQRGRHDHIQGEQLYGVMPAIDFLKHYHLHPFTTHVHGALAVIGTGHTLFDAAQTALNAGATSVQIVTPGIYTDKEDWTQEEKQAVQAGIKVHTQTMLAGIVGTEDVNVQGVHCQHISGWDTNILGEQQPRRLPGSDFCFKVRTVLLAVGEEIDPTILHDLKQPQYSSTHTPEHAPTQEEIIATLQTYPNVFLAGDMAGGPRTLLHAIETGSQSATDVHNYLRKQAGQAPLLI